MRFIAMTYDTLGHPDRALSWFNFASRLRGAWGEMDAQIGDSWVKLGDDKRGLDAYTRSSELQPARSDGAVGICHLRMLQNDFQGARKLYQTNLLNREDFGESKAIAAQIEFFARNFQQAERLYSDLAAADAEGGGAFYGAVSYQSALGRALQANGDERGSRELLERCFVRETAAIKRQPENPEAFYRLSAIESSLGRLDSAIDHLHRAIQLGWVDHRSLAMDPRFDPLRRNRAFQASIDDLSVAMTDLRRKIH